MSRIGRCKRCRNVKIIGRVQVCVRARAREWKNTMLKRIKTATSLDFSLCPLRRLYSRNIIDYKWWHATPTPTHCCSFSSASASAAFRFSASAASSANRYSSSR